MTKLHAAEEEIKKLRKALDNAGSTRDELVKALGCTLKENNQLLERNRSQALKINNLEATLAQRVEGRGVGDDDIFGDDDDIFGDDDDIFGDDFGDDDDIFGDDEANFDDGDGCCGVDSSSENNGDNSNINSSDGSSNDKTKPSGRTTYPRQAKGKHDHSKSTTSNNASRRTRRGRTSSSGKANRSSSSDSDGESRSSSSDSDGASSGEESGKSKSETSSSASRRTRHGTSPSSGKSKTTPWRVFNALTETIDGTIRDAAWLEQGIDSGVVLTLAKGQQKTVEEFSKKLEKVQKKVEGLRALLSSLPETNEKNKNVLIKYQLQVRNLAGVYYPEAFEKFDRAYTILYAPKSSLDDQQQAALEVFEFIILVSSSSGTMTNVQNARKNAINLEAALRNVSGKSNAALNEIICGEAGGDVVETLLSLLGKDSVTVEAEAAETGATETAETEATNEISYGDYHALMNALVKDDRGTHSAGLIDIRQLRELLQCFSLLRLVVLDQDTVKLLSTVEDSISLYEVCNKVVGEGSQCSHSEKEEQLAAADNGFGQLCTGGRQGPSVQLLRDPLLWKSLSNDKLLVSVTVKEEESLLRPPAPATRKEFEDVKAKYKKKMDDSLKRRRLFRMQTSTLGKMNIHLLRFGVSFSDYNYLSRTHYSSITQKLSSFYSDVFSLREKYLSVTQMKTSDSD